jgi:hypothetical protein
LAFLVSTLTSQKKGLNMWMISLNLYFRCVDIFIPMFTKLYITRDRLCGLVVRVPGYRSKGPGSISDATRCENMTVGIRHADHVASSIRESWHQLRWQAAVAQSV